MVPRRSIERSTRLYALEFLRSAVNNRMERSETLVAVVLIEARSSKVPIEGDPEDDGIE